MQTILIVLSLGIVKIFGFLKDVLIANYFGVSKEVDIYLYTLVIPMLFFNILSGSFNLFFCPFYLKVKTEQGLETARQYASFIFLNVIIILLGLTLLVGFVLPDLFIKMNKAFFTHQDQIIYFRYLSTWSAVFLFCYTFSFMLNSLLQAEHHYILSSYPQILIPVMSIIFMVWLHTDLSVSSILYGQTAGALICCIFLIGVTYRYGLFSFSFRMSNFYNVKTYTQHGVDQFGINIITFTLASLLLTIDHQIASTLGSGKLTIITYGQRIPDATIEILYSGLGIALFTYFSQWFIKGEIKTLIEATQKTIMHTTFFIVPAVSFFIIFRKSLITVLFERGAFSKEATAYVSDIFSLYSLSIYFAIISLVGARIIFAIRKGYFFIKYGILQFIVKIVLSLIFIKFFDLNGIPLAYLSINILATYMVFKFLNLQSIHIFEYSFRKQVLKCFLSTSLIILILKIANLINPNLSNFKQILLGLSLLAIYYLIVLILNNRHRFIESLRIA